MSLAERLATSFLTEEAVHDDADVDRWFEGCKERNGISAEPVGFDDLQGWAADPDTGDIRHESGRFFSVTGVRVQRPGHWREEWDQPIISQPEVGILGFVLREFDGVLHALVQAKIEPGNGNGLQLAPTVQATKSNFTRVHRGAAVPYLEYFLDDHGGRVLVDVLQSEQGTWFWRKQNRNMAVEVSGPVEPHEDFCWMTLRQLSERLRRYDLVNMDARSVMACLPLAGDGVRTAVGRFAAGDPRAWSLSHSLSPTPEQAAEDLRSVTSHLTGARARTDMSVTRIPLAEVREWRHTSEAIEHESGDFFRIVAARIEARGREVRSWSQPMLAPVGEGVCAFLVRRIDGVVHVLARIEEEPGFVDTLELRPTVQCAPATYEARPEVAPAFLRDVLDAPADLILFDAVLSEEGGRFHRALNRYLLVETDLSEAPPGFRYVPVSTLSALLAHPRYVNVQARTLLAAVFSLLHG